MDAQQLLNRINRLTEANRSQSARWSSAISENVRAFGNWDNLGHYRAWIKAKRANRAMTHYARAQRRAVRKLDAMPDGKDLEF